jgi:hypothetical protein
LRTLGHRYIWSSSSSRKTLASEMGLFREGVCLEFALVQSLRMIMGGLVTELPSRPGLRVRPARCGRPAAMSVPGRWLGSKYFDRIWRLRSLSWAGRLSPGWEQGCSGRLERPLGTAFSHRLVPLDVLQLPFPLLWLRSIPPLRISRWCVDDCPDETWFGLLAEPRDK